MIQGQRFDGLMEPAQEGESFGGVPFEDFFSDKELKQCPLRDSGEEPCEGCQ